MFCSNCGSQNPENTQFCTNCGKAVGQHAVANPNVTAAPKKKIMGLPLGGFIGAASGAVALLVVVVLVVVSLFGKPMPTAADASKFLLNAADMPGYDSGDGVDNTDTDTSDWIYGDCDASSNLTDHLQAGTSWARVSWSDSLYISSQIISYPTEAAAQAVLDDLTSASTDDACDSPNIGDYYSGGATVKDKYGVGLDGIDLQDNYDGYESTPASTTHFVAAKRGRVLLVLRTSRDDNDSSVSVADEQAVITKALNRFAGN